MDARRCSRVCGYCRGSPDASPGGSATDDAAGDVDLAVTDLTGWRAASVRSVRAHVAGPYRQERR